MMAYDSWGDSWGLAGVSSAWGTAWYHTTTPPVVTVDTHDGFDDDDTEARKKSALREMLQAAIDPESVRLPILEEVLTVAEPAIAKMEMGAPQIDWQRVERDAYLASRLHGLRAEFERQRQDFDDDEEDVSIILLH